jgi:hypothetical protein
MNRKDYISLMEAYDDVILDKEFSGDDEDHTDSSLSIAEVPHDITMGGNDHEMDHEMDHETSDVSVDDMEDNEEEKQRMVSSNINAIRSHAHEISTCIENGANIEPWMQEKIAIANDYISHVASTILYR